MMKRDVEHDHNEPNGAMAAVLGLLMAVACRGAAVGLLEPAAGVRGSRSPLTAATSAPVEIDAERYEGLRDMLPGDPELARRTLSALKADGRVDEAEFAELVGREGGRRRTSLDVATARGDLLRTARAYAEIAA